MHYSNTWPRMYTASFAFFEALADAGVSHCFVNLGSDHPSIMEAMVKAQKDPSKKFPRIITCPSEVCIDLTIKPNLRWEAAKENERKREKKTSKRC